MVNAWYIRNPPWMQIDRDKNNQGQFSEGWEHVRDRCREIICWRMCLLPYLQAAFAEYERTGMPPFRALMMDYPGDPLLENVDDEYMVGDRLLVAPMFAGEPERKVVFPPGEWQDFWTGENVKGRTQVVPAAVANIPVYVKAGSLMPWGEIGQHTQTPEARRISVRIYGDGSLGWSAPESVGGLKLRWNPSTRRGTVTQDSTAGRRSEVVNWRRIS
jgi:alpha-D-xyloside xylohydrolase